MREDISNNGYRKRYTIKNKYNEKSGYGDEIPHRIFEPTYQK